MLSVEDVGAALVALSLIFALASLVRRHTAPLRSLFIPTAVIGGFLMLAFGPEGVGRFDDSSGLFMDSMIEVWSGLPGQLVNVMCASLLLGERLPPMRTVWKVSASNVVMTAIMSFGMFAIGAILTLVLLGPVFDVSDVGGSLIEISFAGGHGTVAGLSDALADENAADLVDLGFGMATIGLISAIVVGTLLVNYAVKSPSISIARDTPTEPADDYDIDHHQPLADDPPLDENRGMTQVTAAAVFIGVSIALAYVMLEVLRWLGDRAGLTVFDSFPLFPLTIIGGVIVQIAAVRFDFEWAVNRRAVEGIGGVAVDGIVICAIGTLSLSALVDNLGPLVVFSVASVAWSGFVAVVLGRRLFGKYWFEYSISEFGESQGNVATGFMMVDMVDPKRTTGVARAFSLRQLITRPFIGGGIVSALSIPFIAVWGLTTFAIATAVVTGLFVVWGISIAALVADE